MDTSKLPQRSPKTKTVPFRILVHLLYNDVSWAAREGVTAVIKTTPASRALRTSCSRIREYLQWMADNGYCSEPRYVRGQISIDLYLGRINWDGARND